MICAELIAQFELRGFLLSKLVFFAIEQSQRRLVALAVIIGTLVSGERFRGLPSIHRSTAMRAPILGFSGAANAGWIE